MKSDGGHRPVVPWDAVEKRPPLQFDSLLLVLDSLDADIYAADMDTHEVLYMNCHMRDSFGGDFTGRICHNVFRNEAAPCQDCSNSLLIDAAGNPTGVFVWEGRNAITGRWYKNSDRVIPWDDGRMVRLQIATDITDLKAAQERLQHLATHDPLTGLSNRQLFEDRLGHAVHMARRTATKLAVLFIDLDGFKAVNDNHGHAAGDDLLREVARRLTATVREVDTVARLAGDEFAIILEKTSGPESARKVAERALQNLCGSCIVNGIELTITASIGIACFPEDAETPQALVHLADEAMYQSKGGGKNAVSHSR